MSTYGSSYPLTALSVQYGINGAYTSTFQAGNYLSAKAYTRSGTNRNISKKNSGAPKVYGPWVLKTVTVPKGPRLPYRVYSQRLKKYVWARKPIQILKLVREKTKQKPIVKGANLLPNDLDFKSLTFTYSGSLNESGYGSLSGYSPSLNRTQNYRGHLLTGFQTYYGSYNYLPSTYLDRSLSNSQSSELNAYVSKADSRALARLYSKVKHQEVNLAQALAERAQTARCIGDTLTRIVTALRALRRGNLSKAVKTALPGDTKAVANDWLVLQYGIKPLISDIQGAFSHLSENQEIHFDVKVSATEEFPYVPLSPLVYTSRIKGNDTMYLSGKVTVSYKVRCRLRSNVGYDLSRLGFTNLESLLWEVTPYSFVADWLYPLGNYLNTHDAFSQVDVLWVTKTVFLTENRTFTRSISGTSADGFIWPTTGFALKSKFVSCKRTLTGIVPPLPRPSFKDPVSAGHILNAAALIRQLK